MMSIEERTQKVKATKPGDKLFVPDKQKARFGDSVSGGLATIDTIRQRSDGTYVTTKETDKIQWHLETLIINQERYEGLYKGFEAKFHTEDFERDNFIW